MLSPGNVCLKIRAPPALQPSHFVLANKKRKVIAFRFSLHCKQHTAARTTFPSTCHCDATRASASPTLPTEFAARARG